MGAMTPPKMPQEYIFGKKLCQISLFFCPELCSEGLQQPFMGQECPPPQDECPLQDKFLATPMKFGNPTEVISARNMLVGKIHYGGWRKFEFLSVFF